MSARKTLKGAFLAAAAVTVVGAASAHAAAVDAAPTEMVAPVDHAGDEAKASAPAEIGRKVGIAALATAALAGLFHLVGGRRVKAFLDAAAPVAAKTAAAVAKAPAAAARAVGRAAASPFRFILLMGGLGVFALTGISVFDIEWTAGLALGAIMTALAFFAVNGTRKALVRKAAKIRRPAADDTYGKL